jgi:hypothetical protein
MPIEADIGNLYATCFAPTPESFFAQSNAIACREPVEKVTLARALGYKEQAPRNWTALLAYVKMHILIFSLAFFLLTAANQYSRMQFNTGVRHIVPVTPFMFLLTAGMLLRMRTLLAALVGVVTTYWSWCLAMYRDVEQGLGVFESLIHITLEGFRLPLLTTLERLDYVARGSSPIPLLALAGVLIYVLWNVRRSALTDPAHFNIGKIGSI